MGLDKFSSKFCFLVLVILSLNTTFPISSEPHCMWYGLCGSPPGVDWKKLNCYYNGSAKPASQKVLSILEKWCPHYFDKVSENKTCCDDAQMTNFELQIGQAAVLISRCPSCTYNFVEHFCEFTCRPDHTLFMELLKTGTSSTGQKAVTEVNLYITKSYLHGTYDSCKDIYLPLANQYVMDLLCNRPVISCTPELWFDFVGDFNQFSPFQINYKTSGAEARGFEPLSIKTFACNEKPLENLPTCGCSDCAKSCPPGQAEPPPSRIYVGSILLGHFITILIFIIGEALIITLLVYFWKREIRINKHGEDLGPSWLTVIFTKIRHAFRKLELAGAKLEEKIEQGFGILGRKCATQPWIFVIANIHVILILSLGICRMKMTTDPVELWASPNSRTRLNQIYYDSHFNPFYRTEQIIIHAIDLPNVIHNASNRMVKFGPVFHDFFLLDVFRLQQSILKISAGGITLKDLCEAPLTETNTANKISDCVVESIWGYLQDNSSRIDKETYLQDLLVCLKNPYLPEHCLAPWGGPVLPDLAFGGFTKLDSSGNPEYETATTLIVTYVLKNHLDKRKQNPAKKWESEFIDLLKKWSKNEKPDYMKISFSSERSVEDELERTTKADVSTIVVSYSAMFLYIVISLGKYTSFKRCLVERKITLAFTGIFLVVTSVSCSIGFFGFVGVPVTPIIMEVIPFLVLAVGVDNIFIFVQTYDRLDERPGESVEERIGRMMGIAGPSVTLTSLSECCCFFIGALSSMPAVRAFALYAGLALLLDFIFQITCFVSLLAIDVKREKENRFDVLCCWKCKYPQSGHRNFFLYCFENFYARYVLHRYVRPVIIVAFFALFCLSLAAIPVITIGLSQEISMSKDSYLYSYFQDLKEYLSIGPPVYFVVENSPLDYSDPEIQNMFCDSPTCHSDSLTYQIYEASKASNTTYIATPASSWIDDYLDWSSSPACCRWYSNKTFCPHADESCEPCDKDPVQSDRPSSEDFKRYISFFLADNPDSSCSKGGHPSYRAAVKLHSLGLDSKGMNASSVGSNYFMAYHTILRSSEDYYTALDSALKISDNITKTINHKISKLGFDFTVKVFPYSIFYVYYEQYLTLWKDAVKGIMLSFLAILVATIILLGLDIWSACLVVSTIIMTVVDILGLMYLWDVELNAISLVNLVLAVGMSVEFCSHITHYFVTIKGQSRIHRASLSLVQMGSSVFSGIIITKIIGIVVLAFSKSQIFQVFYFRMFLAMMLLGASHGLIYLPVLLSYIGSDTHLFYLQRDDRQEAKEDHPEEESTFSKEDENVKPKK